MNTLTTSMLKQHLNNSAHTLINKSNPLPNLNNQSIEELTVDSTNDLAPVYRRQFQHRGASAHFMGKVLAS